MTDVDQLHPISVSGVFLPREWLLQEALEAARLCHPTSGSHSYLLPWRGIPARHHAVRGLRRTGSLAAGLLQAAVWSLDVPAPPLREGDQLPVAALLSALELSLPQAGPAGG